MEKVGKVTSIPDLIIYSLFRDAVLRQKQCFEKATTPFYSCHSWQINTRKLGMVFPPTTPLFFAIRLSNMPN